MVARDTGAARGGGDAGGASVVEGGMSGVRVDAAAGTGTVAWPSLDAALRRYLVAARPLRNLGPELLTRSLDPGLPDPGPPANAGSCNDPAAAA